MTRHRLGSVTAEVQVDVDDVLDELEDEVLLDEVQRRKLTPRGTPYAIKLRALLHEQPGHAGPLFLCPSEACRILADLAHHEEALT